MVTSQQYRYEHIRISTRSQPRIDAASATGKKYDRRLRQAALCDADNIAFSIACSESATNDSGGILAIDAGGYHPEPPL
jgi:hypothetical protein